jgi:replicative DNA helicase
MSTNDLIERIEPARREEYTEAYENLDPFFLVRKPMSFEDDVLCIVEGRRDGTPCPLIPKLGLRPGELTIWGGINGHGKALDLRTPIPTTEGWKTMGEVHPGDYVFDENGKPCRVVAETEIQYNRPCFLVTFSDGTEIVADAEHEWLTDDYKSRRSRSSAKHNGRLESRPVKKFGTDQTHKRSFAAIRTTREIAGTLLFNNAYQKNKKNHSITVCQPIEYPEQSLPIPPYTLGAWLGDGTSDCGAITTPDQHVLDRIRADGFEITERKAKLNHGILGLHVLLRENGLLKSKHVPAIYLKSSIQQRLALLQGLMDSDGYCSQHTCEFCSTNRKLAEAVCELATSLGCIVHLIEGRARLYGKDCGEKFRVTFTTAFEVFSLPRKKERLPKEVAFRAKERFIVKCERCESVPVKCIQVDSPSHLYLASKSCVPTHNSLLTGQIALTLASKGIKPCIVSLEMPPSRTLVRMCGQWIGHYPSGAQDVPAAQKFLREFQERMLFFDYVGRVDLKVLFGAITIAAQQRGCRHILIDNLMSCVDGEDDYNAQKDFVQTLCQLAKQLSVHIHLVHHVRKGKDELEEIGKFSFRGSGAITDSADNVVTIQRNKKKELRREKNELSLVEDYEEADTIVTVCKQRNGRWEGRTCLWLDPESGAYCVDGDRKTQWGSF